LYVGEDSYARLTNCTVTGNRAADNGGALYINDADDAILTNCVLWADTPQEIYPEMPGSGTVITHSDVQGAVPDGGNINADPRFAEPGYWNLNGTPEDTNDDAWVDGDYHLKSQAGRWKPNSQSWVIDDVTSPCIDVGDPMTPIMHELFPNGGIINMGAYGGTAEASKSYFGKPPCEIIVAGDVNGDCIVDFRDFMLMALHWCEDNNP
jgi:predicted outer membrane repeat protein